MKKISVLDRILLLITGGLAAYQVVTGISEFNQWAMACLTIAFGTLLVAGLILIIMGYDVLESKLVVITATLIPLSLSLGLVAEHASRYRWFYAAFAIIGFAGVVFSRIYSSGSLPTIILALVHGTAGLIIAFLPITLSLTGSMPAGYSFVGVGGILIGIGGLLLAFLKVGRPILSEKFILTVLPGLLMLMTISFVIGFSNK